MLHRVFRKCFKGDGCCLSFDNENPVLYRMARPYISIEAGKMNRLWMLLMITACLFCQVPSALSAGTDAVRAFVSIAPQKYFVERIGGGRVAVSVLVPSGADPHTYEPKPQQMAGLARSDVYFSIGIDFERVWLKRIAGTHPQMRIVPTDAGIEKILMPGHRHSPKKAGGRAKDQHHHHKGSADPHVWLAPAPVKIQAGHIRDALISIDPHNRMLYQANYEGFLKEINGLDAEIKAMFSGREGMPFLVFHPSWGYFAQAFGIEQVPIEIEGKDPKPAQLQTIIKRARERRIRVVFVQPQFSAKSAEMISRAIDGRVVYVDPLAEEWSLNMRAVARKLLSAAP
jgi:zinc transport system substrate-binding protein